MNITAGKFKGRKVIAPDAKIVRPTLAKVRENIFNILASMINFKFDDKNFLYMFAGSSIMGLEALSRGFSSALEIENNLKVVKIINQNYANLGLKPELIVGDSLKKIKNLTKKYDVIFIDPPYFSGIYESSIDVILKNKVMKKDGIIILEHVTAIDWQNFGLEMIKQKKYSEKYITFLKISQ